MKYNYFKEKEALALGIKLASERAQSKNVTDVLVEFVKLAVPKGWKKPETPATIQVLRLEDALKNKFQKDRPSQEAINHTLSLMNSTTNLEKNKKLLPHDPLYNEYVNFINQNKDFIYDVLSERRRLKPDHKSRLFMKEDSRTNIYDYIIRNLFTTGEPQIMKAIAGCISSFYITDRKKWAKEQTGFSEEVKDIIDGKNRSKDGEPINEDEIPMGGITPEIAIRVLENVKMGAGDNPAVNYYVDVEIKKIQQMISTMEAAENNEDYALVMELEADFDEEWDKIYSKLKGRLNPESAQFTPGGKLKKNAPPYGVLNVAEEVSRMAPDDEMIDHIYESTTNKHHPPFAKWVKWLRDRDPILAKLLLKTGFRALLSTNIAKAMKVPMSSTESIRDQRGAGKLSLGDLWRRDLVQAIDATVPDPELNKQYKQKIDEFFASTESSPATSRLKSQLVHLPGLLHSGLISKLLKENPNGLTPEQEAQFVNEVVNKYYPFYEKTNHINSALPHIVKEGNDVDKGKLVPTDFEKSGHTREQARAIIEKTIRDRLKNAQDIVANKLTEGSLLAHRNDDEPKLSNRKSIFRRE